MMSRDLYKKKNSMKLFNCTRKGIYKLIVVTNLRVENRIGFNNDIQLYYNRVAFARQ